MELVRDGVGSEQTTGTGERRMLSQKIRVDMSLLHTVQRSELNVVFLTLRGSR
jgi:hypothetical protein